MFQKVCISSKLKWKILHSICIYTNLRLISRFLGKIKTLKMWDILNISHLVPPLAPHTRKFIWLRIVFVPFVILFKFLSLLSHTENVYINILVLCRGARVVEALNCLAWIQIHSRRILFVTLVKKKTVTNRWQ